MAKKNERHGQSAGGRITPTLCSYRSMLTRCTNPKANSYELYGGRGISVCQRWLDSFDAFLADMGERPAGTTLDRIDSDGNYEPGNCRWATIYEQNRNRRPFKRREPSPPMAFCINGHEMTEANTGWQLRLDVHGGDRRYRYCRKCSNASRDKSRGKALA